MRVALTQGFLMLLMVGVSWAHPTKAQEYLNKRLTIRADNQEIKKILAEIEKATEVQFVYSSQVIDTRQRVSLHVVNITLEEVLTKLLKPLTVRYQLVGRKLVLSPTTSAVFDNIGLTDAPILAEQAEKAAPKKIVTGRVTDENSAGMPGVSILIWRK